ncbi:hypothetical protein Vi05172_g11758 [Venturia inaequalis]|nr:hypothetical protein Vi05172_g11758 [Venturia inaequalis]
MRKASILREITSSIVAHSRLAGSIEIRYPRGRESANVEKIGTSLGQQCQNEDDIWDDSNWLDPLRSFQDLSILSFLGSLGELQPISGNTKSWEWVIEKLKDVPRLFAQNAETTFIHKELCQEDFHLQYEPPSESALLSQ